MSAAPGKAPTKHDLLMLLEWAGHEAASCAGLHYDDRSRTSFAEAQKRLEGIQKIVLKVTGCFPQSNRKGRWAKWAAEQNAQHKGAY